MDNATGEESEEEEDAYANCDGGNDGGYGSDATEYSTDEETTLKLRPRPEQMEIEHEIQSLVDAVPQLGTDFQVLDKLGSGTFSSVYKARDLRHDEYDNSVWKSTSYCSEASRAEGQRKDNLVAVKRIYVTSSPERIKNEIHTLADVVGCSYVGQLITAFRVRDQVVAIMSYHRHVDFRTFYGTLTVDGWRNYFYCLFSGLKDIHARKIIHRDVKPANFLFDPRTGHGTLVDFGLAQHIQTDVVSTCNHTPPNEEFPHGRYPDMNDDYMNALRTARKNMRARRTWPSERVGWPADEKGCHASRANRAGTRGFRAPEVLFKCNNQSGAVDVWAAGTILLFFLTKRIPIYSANDDIAALMELATILGHKRMEKAAISHNRSFITNVPGISEEGVTWRDFVLKLNPTLYDDHEEEREVVDQALDFLDKCLQADATRRITANNALKEPFISYDEVEG
ncbi:kinase-like protein [Auriculariales sp. MPI-PUGE-AT-0066]|nr:kinase-like protein [Auriculariales sp. MPI-PUGE-AT-0066]